MENVTETALPSAVLDSYKQCAASAMELLKLDPKKVSTSAIVEKLDQFVFDWQDGDRPDPSELQEDDAPLILGCLWGQALVSRFKWEWGTITFHDHKNTKAPGVLSPDRGLAIYPIHFLMGALRDPGVDCTVMLSYNMIKAGTLGPQTPNAYLNLMDYVHRIVPRR